MTDCFIVAESIVSSWGEESLPYNWRKLIDAKEDTGNNRGRMPS